MSNSDWNDNDDEDEIDETPRERNNDGGDLVRQLRRQLKEKDKELTTVKASFVELNERERVRTVKEVLEKRGVNVKAARLILKDLDTDVTEDAVEGWLKDNGELFGIISLPKGLESDNSISDTGELLRQDASTQGATTPSVMADLSQKLDAANSQEELLAILRN